MRVGAWWGGLPQGVELLASSCGTQLWGAQGSGLAFLEVARETNTVISPLTCPER